MPWRFGSLRNCGPVRGGDQRIPLGFFGARLGPRLECASERKDGSGGLRCDGYNGHGTTGITVFGFIFFLEEEWGYPTPGGFCKEYEAFENKGDEILLRAKSAQG